MKSRVLTSWWDTRHGGKRFASSVHIWQKTSQVLHRASNAASGHDHCLQDFTALGRMHRLVDL